mmetsp:Transcript_15501/g.48514  ORF Transcript_15501/g.48514 Transcript_15501/m.48514 type:complete len:116 (+) Transcript_15501:650-997(+)
MHTGWERSNSDESPSPSPLPAAPQAPDQHAHAPDVPVRRREERDALPGAHCADCESFYTAAGFAGQNLTNLLNKCSRHRAAFHVSNTPPGYWEVGWNSPKPASPCSVVRHDEGAG